MVMWPGKGNEPDSNKPDTKFQEKLLRDAENLLTHARATGVDVDPKLYNAFWAARQSQINGWKDNGWKDLLFLYSSLSKEFIPVTPETLRAGEESAKWTIRKYKLVVVILAVILVPLSIAMFANSKMSEMLIAQIAENNALAVTLATTANERTGRPADAGDPVGGRDPDRALHFSQLQTFSQMSRSIYSRAKQLNYFVWPREEDPSLASKDFEVAPNVPPIDQVYDKIGLYQVVRSFATSVQGTNSVTYGAITAYLLPIMYALLGALAFLVRDFARRTVERSFEPSYTTPTFIAAGIGGGMVGFFNGFTNGASVSPLAVAFLVGYAADVFYSFLETLVQAFRNPGQNAPPKSPKVVVVEKDTISSSSTRSPAEAGEKKLGDNAPDTSRTIGTGLSSFRPNGPGVGSGPDKLPTGANIQPQSGNPNGTEAAKSQ